MRNFFPHGIELTHKFDLKGSTISREAGEKEKKKAQPTYRDLDFNEIFKSLYLEPQYYDEVEKSIKFDSTVLDAYNIFDYSLLLGVVRPKDQRIIKGKAESLYSFLIYELRSADEDVAGKLHRHGFPGRNSCKRQRWFPVLLVHRNSRHASRIRHCAQASIRLESSQTRTSQSSQSLCPAAGQI
jgi:hypothetical protein